MFYDSEAQPSAAQFAGAGFIDTVKALGESRQILFGDSCTGICHCNFDPRIRLSAEVRRCSRDRDRSP
jgi:hypothetical protein